jgi:prepilin-type N-terminal cleavage/methylation domain-containing protein
MITKKNKGFLLVEVLITVVILSVGLTLIARSLITGIKSLEIIKQYTTGYSLLEEKLWDIERKYFIESGLNKEEDFLEPYQDFTYSLETENIKDNEEKGMLNKVLLSVNWPTKFSRREISVVTYLFDKK